MSRLKTALGKGVGLASGAVLAAAVAGDAWAEDLLGQPTPGAIDLQPAASSLKHQVIFFHNIILLPIITAISLFVLALLLYVVFRFNKRTNPVPARWSHNTPIEVIWTVLPVLILMVIAIFSFRLLYAYHDMPKPDLTVKATGNQWYWSYEYPDNGGYAFDSHMLPEDQAKAQGVPYRLAADKPLVVPVGKVVRVLVTGADVIHAFALPAFGNKIDAIPGRVNETWFKAEKTGVYYGQCSELCGVDHAFMPIQINVMDQAGYDAWIAAKAPKPAAVPAAPAAAAAAAAAPAAPAAGTPATPAPGAAPTQGAAPVAPAART
ncbi:MAG TPA: cytochrome c oxidase subunit II [Caulobacteraceae bacterium]|nr:cytochrome c oxidase subunit II [Caulobacteraceae bacterium]